MRVSRGEGVQASVAAWKSLHAPRIPDLVWTPHNGGHWIATRGAGIVAILNDADRFSARVMIVPKAAGMEHKLIPMNMDPPEHTPYRRVLNTGLRRRGLGRIETSIRAVAVALIDAFAADGRVDFCVAYANIFPIKVFLAFSDLPIADAPALTAFASDVVRPTGDTPEQKATSMRTANEGFFAYLAPTVAARRVTTGSARSSTAR